MYRQHVAVVKKGKTQLRKSHRVNADYLPYLDGRKCNVFGTPEGHSVFLCFLILWLFQELATSFKFCCNISMKQYLRQSL